MTRVRHDGGVSGVSNQPTISSASGIWTLKDAEKYNRAGQWPAFYGSSDQYFQYNSVLIHADGVSGGANNNVFVDSSVNSTTITRTGTATQGTFSPFSTTGWSNYFNGSTDYLTYNQAIALGTSDFTIEMWAYSTSFSVQQWLWGQRNSADTSMYIFINTSGQIVVGGDITSYITSSSLSLNTWNHIALVRTGGNSLKLYINGIQSGSTSTTTQSFTYTGTQCIAHNTSGAGYYFTGYISNVRVIQGTGLYTSNFTPPLAALTAITNTSILTCQSNKFVDNSTNGLAITIGGTPQVQPFSPLVALGSWSSTNVGGSMYYNGTSDYIQATVASAPGTGNFTMEGWVYFSAFSSGSANIFSLIAASSSTGFQVYVNSAGFGVRSNIATIITTSGSPKVGQWYHIALVRNSGTITLYSNGVSIGSTATAYTFSDTQFNSGYTPVGQYFGGYVSNIRYSNTAIYTASFTPPTAPFTAISSTVLLVNGTNAGIFDQAQKSDFITAGSVAVSSTQSKFGGSSMYFPGTSYVRAPHNAMLDLSTGAPNFTVECWFYTANNTAAGPIVGKDWNAGTTNPSYGIYLSGTATTLVYMIADGTSGSTYNQYIYTGIAINTWYHVALVRNGSNMLSFLNGVLANTLTISITSKDAGTTFNIGTNNNAGNYFNGYIDEVRITKGIARYTSNFTVPSAPFLNN